MPEKPIITGGLRLCIFSPLDNAYSETFIRNHITYLPFSKVVVNGAEWINLSSVGRLLFAHSLFNRIRRKLSKAAGRDDHHREQKALRLFLRRNKIQVVLAEYGHIGAMIYTTCADLGIPLVVHFHGNDASHRPTLEKLKNEYAGMFGYASAILSVSNAMTERLKRLGAPADKIIYNCYGIDTALFSTRSEQQGEGVGGDAIGGVAGEVIGRVGGEAPTFVAVGRFVEKKAPHLTIAAFSMIRRTIPSARLIMIGDGPLLEACRQLAKAGGVGDGVEFAGIRSPNEVASIVARSLAFVQHSVTGADGSAEGTPLAILEAGACGVPVVSTRHEGIKDVVIENETGLLVDEFDVEGMAKAMETLAAEPGLAAQMGKKARAHIIAHYPLSKHIDTLAKAINDSIIAK